MKSRIEIKARCPECGYQVDDASVVGTDEPLRPEPDDLALCVRCAGPGIYILNEDGTLGLRLCTAEEKVELSENVLVQKTREAIEKTSKVWLFDKQVES